MGRPQSPCVPFRAGDPGLSSASTADAERVASIDLPPRKTFVAISFARGIRALKAYSRLQIAVHWAVVGMIAVQWATSGAIPRTHNPLLPAAPVDLLLHMVHNYNGMAIGFLVFVRVALRSWRGTDPQQARRTPAELAALAVHWAIYLTLLAQAASGFIASYLWGPAANVHKAIWNVTLVLIALHLTAAAWHGFRRDGVVGRMLPLRARAVSGK